MTQTQWSQMTPDERATQWLKYLNDCGPAKPKLFSEDFQAGFGAGLWFFIILLLIIGRFL